MRNNMDNNIIELKCKQVTELMQELYKEGVIGFDTDRIQVNLEIFKRISSTEELNATAFNSYLRLSFIRDGIKYITII